MINRGTEFPQSSGLPVLPGSMQRDRGDLAAPRLLSSTSSPGQEKGLGKLAQTPLPGARSSPPPRPHAARPGYFPAHPVPLSFARVQRHAEAGRAQLQASLGPISSLRQELGVRTACQEQQQLHPVFSGNSQVISKLVLRDHGQGPKTHQS